MSFFTWTRVLIIGIYWYLTKKMSHAEGRGGDKLFNPDGTPYMIRQVTKEKLIHHLHKRFGPDFKDDRSGWFRRLFTGSCFTRSELEEMKKLVRTNKKNTLIEIASDRQKQTANMTKFYIDRQLKNGKLNPTVAAKLSSIKEKL